MQVDLRGKAAVVTGGSRGIGAAISRSLAAAGASVLITFRQDETAARAVVEQIRAAGGTAACRQADVCDRDATAAAIDEMACRAGRLDILVNNAGIVRDALVPEMAEADWHAVIETNLSGVFTSSRAAVPYMLRRKWGRIINISSVGAWRGHRGQGNYAASKAAVNALTRVMATEFGPRGITVNAVAPGLIETDMSRALLPFAEEAIRERIPLRRVGRPRTWRPWWCSWPRTRQRISPGRCSRWTAVCSSRLLKKGHLLRWPASALAAAYLQYASLGRRPAAWHLGLFEQPERRGYFSMSDGGSDD